MYTTRFGNEPSMLLYTKHRLQAMGSRTSWCKKGSVGQQKVLTKLDMWTVPRNGHIKNEKPKIFGNSTQFARWSKWNPDLNTFFRNVINDNWQLELWQILYLKKNQFDIDFFRFFSFQSVRRLSPPPPTGSSWPRRETAWPWRARWPRGAPSLRSSGGARRAGRCRTERPPRRDCPWPSARSPGTTPASTSARPTTDSGSHPSRKSSLTFNVS